tara:strand:+ start:20 stop:124 length:105 start_codon:yes stop_codon:yes gene_type:complete
MLKKVYILRIDYLVDTAPFIKPKIVGKFNGRKKN